MKGPSPAWDSLAPEPISIDLLGFLNSSEKGARAAELLDQTQSARLHVDHLTPAIEDVYGGLISAHQYTADAARLKSVTRRLGWGDDFGLDAADIKLRPQEAEFNRVRELLILMGKRAVDFRSRGPFRPQLMSNCCG